MPQLFLIRMAVFLVIIGFLTAILFPQLAHAFAANPLLNGIIIAVLLLGICYSFREILRLKPEIKWVNEFRVADPGLELATPPQLLGPMAIMLSDRQGQMSLNTISMRSLLDSIASRLDESRDILRYLIGLLVFLGLLGTFWGLLDTVSSVAETISGLSTDASQPTLIFEELRAGLAAPLRGMGTAFSSSLLGLASSLVLGFLELQTSQAQNRFYTELEDWLSTVTNLDSAETASGPSSSGGGTLVIQRSLDRLQTTLSEDVSSRASVNKSLLSLAQSLQDLTRKMRAEQQAVRNWAQAQADQQAILNPILERLASAIEGDSLLSVPKPKRPRRRKSAPSSPVAKPFDPDQGEG